MSLNEILGQASLEISQVFERTASLNICAGGYAITLTDSYRPRLRFQQADPEYPDYIHYEHCALTSYSACEKQGIKDCEVRDTDFGQIPGIFYVRLQLSLKAGL